MKKSFLFLFVILVCSSAFSQGTWTLEECIRYAQENNIQIKREVLNTQFQKNQLRESKMNLLPDIGAQVNHEWGRGKVATQEFSYVNDVSQGTLGIGAGMDLFNGLRNYNRIERDKIDLQASFANLEKAKNDLALNVATYYLNVLYDLELLKVAEVQKSLTEEQLNRTKIQVDAGNAAMGDFLEIQSQMAAEKLNVVEAKNKIALDNLELSQLLDLPDTINFKIYIPDTLTVDVVPIESVNSIYLASLENRPEILYSELNMNSAQKNLDIAKGARYPSLSLNAYKNTRYSIDAKNPVDPDDQNYTILDQFDDNQYFQTQLSLQIPIFYKGQISSEISRKRIALDDSKYQYDLAKLKLYKEIQQAHNDAVSAMAKFESAKESIRFSAEALDYAKKKFEVGLVNSYDFNLAKTSYNKAQADLIRSKYEYYFSIKVLDFYKGVNLDL